jgi:hypothetical protein
VQRMLLILTVALVMAAMMVASALPALAQGPPTIPPPGAAHAVPNVMEHNQAITIVSQNPPCVVLSTPGPGVGHHSDFPDDCSGLVP